MEFISHAVKELSQLKKICKDGYVRATDNLIQEGKFTKDLTYDYVGDSYVGYTKHVMCALGFGYMNNRCPAAILFKTDIVDKKSLLYPLPYKYEFFLGLAKIIWEEHKKGIKDWKKILEKEKAFERKGFPPFNEYMNFFLNINKKLCFDNVQYGKVWGPSVYSKSFIKIIIPKLKKSQINFVKSKIKTIKGHAVKKFIDLATNEKQPCEILLPFKIRLEKIYGFAVKKKFSNKVDFLSKYDKPIIWV